MTTRAKRTSVAIGAAAMLLIGCGPPDAPEDLDALTHFLFREWGHALPSVMQDGVAELDGLLNALPLDDSLDERSFRVSELVRDDIVGVPWPANRDPKNAIGSCVARRSKWPIEDQARYIAEADQLAAEPSAKSYVRRFLDPVDPACFVDASCPVSITANDVSRANALLTVTFELHKHYRWVALGADAPLGAGRRAIAARSYIDRTWNGSKDGTSLKQSASIDVFLGQADGRAIRYQCSWSESDFNLAVDDDLQLSVLIDAVDEALGATDDAIEARFHAM